jgi:hypothetical protein
MYLVKVLYALLRTAIGKEWDFNSSSCSQVEVGIGDEGLQDILPLAGDLLDTIMSESSDIGKVGEDLDDLTCKS